MISGEENHVPRRADRKIPAARRRENFSRFPGLLSFLVPGLGQIYQGRVGKGVLFFVSIYALFFYGMYLGSGTVKAGEPEKTYTVSGIFSSAPSDAPPCSAPPTAPRPVATTA